MEQAEKIYHVSIELIEDRGMNYAGQTIDEVLPSTTEGEALKRVMEMHELHREGVKVNYIGLWRENE